MKTWVKIGIPAAFFLIVIGFIGWRVQVGTGMKPAKTITASYQTVTKDIAFTGITESVESANLSFEVSGTVKNLFVAVGDRVQRGQQLASLDPQSASLQIAKAEADKAGSASVAYIGWQNAVQTQKDTAVENTKLIEAKKQAVRDAKASLTQAEQVCEQKTSETESLDSTTLSTCSAATANQSLYHAAQAGLTSALQAVKTSNNAAKHATDVAHAQYINTQQASQDTAGLSSLDALAKIAEVNAAKSILRAPFDGVVTQKTAAVGEFAAAGNAVVSIAKTNELQISADVPETDALALTPTLHTSITFDALASHTSTEATVAQIYPAAKAIQGVPTFHVIVTLNAQSSDLRPGITANIIVHADKREHVIAIPRRAVSTKSGKTYVTKQTGQKTTEEVEVHTGLLGSDGLEEITSGVNEGDVLITQ